jgi:Lrp/AsnC family transcriptional regulator
MGNVDRIDLQLLEALQNDASVPIHVLAERVCLSVNACWRRVRRLDKEGYIRRRVALLDAERLGCGVVAFVIVRTNQHTERWLREFAEKVAAIPEITEIYRTSGEIDYLLKVLVRSIADYDRVYKTLIKTMPLADVSASFAMEQIKCTTAVPLAAHALRSLVPEGCALGD